MAKLAKKNGKAKLIVAKKTEEPPAPHLDVVVSEFKRVQEHALCDRFELVTADNEQGVFFHRKKNPQWVFFKHSAFKAKRVRVTVEVLEA